jgi:hypothetical protein
MGERFLLFSGNLIKTGSGQNGQQALRAALINAAAADGSISTMDIIRHFPGASVRIDLDRIFLVAR